MYSNKIIKTMQVKNSCIKVKEAWYNPRIDERKRDKWLDRFKQDKSLSQENKS